MNQTGRKPQWSGRCRCPKCRHDVSRVQSSSAQEDGTYVRIRVCAGCGQTWWTAQEPEYVLPVALRGYRRGKPIMRQENSPTQ